MGRTGVDLGGQPPLGDQPPLGASTGEVPERLPRFDATERWLHWVTAALFLVLLATGAVLYAGSLSAVVGRRELLRSIHVAAGLALPVPLLVAWGGRRWSGRLRADLARLNRWTPADRRWLGQLVRWRPGHGPAAAAVPALGKFNPGQKLNTAFTAGAGLVMLATGIVMRWFGPFPLSWRTGATFVHDLVSAALLVVIAGHVVLAVVNRDALWSMIQGSVSSTWSRRHAPGWHAELTGGAPSPAGGNSSLGPQPAVTPGGTAGKGKP